MCITVIAIPFTQTEDAEGFPLLKPHLITRSIFSQYDCMIEFPEPSKKHCARISEAFYNKTEISFQWEIIKMGVNCLETFTGQIVELMKNYYTGHKKSMLQLKMISRNEHDLTESKARQKR